MSSGQVLDATLVHTSGGTEVLPGLPMVGSLKEVVELQTAVAQLFLRFGAGPEIDEGSERRDRASGYLLPGVPCRPLSAEPWWAGGKAVWVARQLVEHTYLVTGGRMPWLVTGRVVGRGADGEPLLADAVTVAGIRPDLLKDAESVYAAWRCRDIR